jgi:methanogenic corrinoid protein MtbC1
MRTFLSMNETRKDTGRHPIRVVSKRTGLTPAVLRAWEKRYGVVTPSRTEGGQRLYSDEDVERLALLGRAVDEGRKISRVAELSLEELRELVREDEVERREASPPEALGRTSAAVLLERATSAVQEMDQRGLERLLTRAAMAHPVPVTLDRIVSPLLGVIGDGWEDGTLTPAHEHLAAGVIRRFLEWLLETVSVEENAPAVVTTTTPGDRHELGALITAVSAAAEGWRAVFLGPDLPPQDVVVAADELGARLVALSTVDPPTEEGMTDAVGELRRRLPEDIGIVVGGPAVAKSGKMAAAEGVQVLTSQEDFREMLRESG